MGGPIVFFMIFEMFIKKKMDRGNNEFQGNCEKKNQEKLKIKICVVSRLFGVCTKFLIPPLGGMES